MKNLKQLKIVLIAILVTIQYTADAQFWKKLKDKTEDAVERAVINRAAHEAAKKASEGVGKLFEIDLGDGEGGMGMVDPSELPASYNFNWRYSLQMESREGNLIFHYLLNEDETYFASRPEMEDNPMANNVMIFDAMKHVMVILSEHEQSKTGTAFNVNLTNTTGDEIENPEDVYGEYSYKKLDTKEILGYTCQGFQVENEDYIITSYVALNTPVSFMNMAQGMPKNLPKGFDPGLLENAENSLMMEMQMEHKKKDKRNMTMKCVALEEEENNFQLSDYDFSFQQQAQ